MAITTYSELQTAIANFLARDDLTSRIPEYIELAEARMSRELDTRSQEKRATAPSSMVSLNSVPSPGVRTTRTSSCHCVSAGAGSDACCSCTAAGSGSGSGSGEAS